MKRERFVRGGLLLVILLSGLAMMPFVDLPVSAINWKSLAGVYEPVLDVNATSGEPGSVFAFTGSNYPENTTAVAYVDGEPLGPVSIDANGVGTFLLNTLGAEIGQYNVTLEVDINASATQSIELVTDGNVVLPPGNFDGPTFYVGSVRYLPILANP